VCRSECREIAKQVHTEDTKGGHSPYWGDIFLITALFVDGYMELGAAGSHLIARRHEEKLRREARKHTQSVFDVVKENNRLGEKAGAGLLLPNKGGMIKIVFPGYRSKLNNEVAQYLIVFSETERAFEMEVNGLPRKGFIL
jgi:hypothetical protein